MTRAIEPFARAAFEALEPLEDGFRNPGSFGILLRQLGFDETFSDDDLESLIEPFRPLADDATLAIDKGRTAIAVLETPQAPIDEVLLAIRDLIEAVKTLVRMAQRIKPAIDAVDLSSFPTSLSSAATWDADVAKALPEYLLVSYLERTQPVLFGILQTLGVVPDGTYELDFSGLGALISDPVQFARDRFQFGNNLLGDLLLEKLSELVGRTGASTRIAPLDSAYYDLFASATPSGDQLELPFVQGFFPGGYAELGLVVAPVPEQNNTDVVDGVLFAPLVHGTTGNEVKLGESGAWTLTFDAELDAATAVTVRVHPGGIYAEGSLPDGGAAVTLAFEPDEEWVLLGSPEGSRIEVSGLQVEARMSTDPAPNAGDIALRARTTGSEGPGLKVVVDATEGDSFISELFSELSVEAALDLDASWSANKGFQFGASSSLSHHIALAKKIGPLTVHSLDIEASKAPSGGPALTVRSNVGAELGPFAVDVEGLGFSFAMERDADQKGNIGPFDIDVGIVPPIGLGFDINSEGVSGGGYLFFDGAEGRYGGGLSLQMGKVGITALGLLSVPRGNSTDPWSLLFSLFVELPIPLGFGFTLTGLGGLIGINRTFSTQRLQQGVQAGSLDQLMFPSRPVNFRAVLDEMDACFPEARGNFVIAPMARISWGARAMLTAEIGILLSFDVRTPGKSKFGMLGIIKAMLPDPDAPILEMNLALLGSVDLATRSFSIVASVYDSRLLGTIELSGDMAMHAEFGGRPYFLLSVGGYHPQFTPPSGLPSTMTNLRRLRAALSWGEHVQASLEGYFAVTANTFQLGGKFEIEAAATILGTTYSAYGMLGFNVLFQFRPFRIIADASAMFSIRAGSNEILGIELSIYVEGPKPWYAKLAGSFRFLLFEVDFRIEVGNPAEAEPATKFPLEQEVLEQLAEDDNWLVVGEPQIATWDLVTLAESETPATGEIWIRPDGTLEVKQDVAPLDRKVDIYGTQIISGPDTIALEEMGFMAGATPDPITIEPVKAPFAPSHFTKMSPSDKLSAPSFVNETAGVNFGGSGVEMPSGSFPSQKVEWETFIDGAKQNVPSTFSLLTGLRLHRLSSTAQGLSSGVRTVVPIVGVKDATYTVIDNVTGEPATDVLTNAGVTTTDELTWMQANELRNTAGSNQLSIVPLHSLVTP
ncbi:MAG: DUF6603 domain-containing protein [Myxococcota bacterium]